MVVTTKDCTSLSDTELAEMADLGAERAPGFDIGFLSKAARGVGPGHPGPGGQQAPGLLVLHPRTHRRDALAPGRPGLDRPHDPGRVGPQGDDGRPVPPGPAGLPRRGRPARDPAAHPRRLPGLRRAGRRGAPSGPQGRPARSGPGPAAWPSASGPRAGSTTGPSWSKATARRPVASTSAAPRSSWPTASTELFDGLDAEPGRPAGGLRLGHGRGPGRRGQARALRAGSLAPAPAQLRGRTAVTTL